MLWLPIGSKTGASLTHHTVRSKASESVSPFPSSTVTVIVDIPNQSAAGVNVNSFPSTSALTFSSSLSALKINSSLSTSVAESVIVNGSSSVVLWFPIGSKTGASFTAVTVRVKVMCPDSASPSLAQTSISVSPVAFSTGVRVNMLSATETVTISVFSVEASKLKSLVSLSISVALNAISMGWSSKVVWSSKATITGASLTAFTVTVTCWVIVSDPSFTLTVTNASPFASTAGVSVTVTVSPLDTGSAGSRVIDPSGNNTALFVVTDTVNSAPESSS